MHEQKNSTEKQKQTNKPPEILELKNTNTELKNSLKGCKLDSTVQMKESMTSKTKHLILYSQRSKNKQECKE